MRKADEVMNDFMQNIKNMRLYQGIDLTNPLTYNFNNEIVQEAFSLEKKIVSTQTGETIKKLPQIDIDDELEI